MTERRPRYGFTPLTMTHAEAADVVFRKSENWLRQHIGEFPTFPRPHPQTGLFHTEQVTIWLRAQYGMAAPPGADREAVTELMIQRINNMPRVQRKPGARILKGALGWEDQDK